MKINGQAFWEKKKRDISQIPEDRTFEFNLAK